MKTRSKVLTEARYKYNDILKDLVKDLDGSLYFTTPIESPVDASALDGYTREMYIGISKEYILVATSYGTESSTIGANNISSSVLKKIIAETKKELKLCQ